MANIKSMKKDLRRNAKARTNNLSVKTSLKTYVKKVRQAAAAGDEKAAGEAVIKVQKAMDKAAQRGVIHPNQAARRKSRAMKAAKKPATMVAEKPAKAAKATKAEPKKAAKPAAKATKAPKAEKAAETAAG